MIVAALTAHNEAGQDRYLARAVSNALTYCDMVVALDDHSTDATAKRLSEYENVEVVRLGASSGADDPFWGRDETTPRALLWRLAAERAGPDGWVYVFDADHELQGITPQDFRKLCSAQLVNAWMFPLWDCWDDDQHMRVDSYWQAHLHPRVWLAKAFPTPTYEPLWEPHAIHSGHIPHNYPAIAQAVGGLAGIRHLGYISPKHRDAKCKRYLAIETLSDFEKAHAASIMETPTLAPIPTARRPKILIASIIRKPQEVVDALLTTLRWQKVDADTDEFFILNYAPNELVPVVDAPHMAVEAPLGDYGEGAITRSWSEGAFGRVAKLKDTILQKALEEGYDYCWLVDADVYADPYTLQTLVDADAPIVSAVYWTNWQLPRGDTTTYVHAGPQVWQQGSYDLSSPYKSAEVFRQELIDRARLKVGGLGACTLIRRDALEKGASFAHFKPLPMGPGGMAEGEDRHFCARAKALHLPLVADAWSDIWHAYHPSEYSQIDARLADLVEEHANAPQFGHLVSATVEHLEPVVDSRGRMHTIGKQYVRGRLGALDLHPQLEQAIASLTRRDSRLVRVHFPIHWPMPTLRGQTRLFRVTLLDCKPFRYAPVIDAELFLGRVGVLDATTLTPPQVASLVEESHESTRT